MITLDRAESILLQSKSLTTNRLYFPENLRLRNKVISHIWLIANDWLSNLNSPVDEFYFRRFNFDQCLQQYSTLKNDYLVLMDGENEIVSKLPLSVLRDECKAGRPLIVNSVIDFSKSYIERDTVKTDGDYMFVFGIKNAAITKQKSYTTESTEVVYNVDAVPSMSGVSCYAAYTRGHFRRTYFEDSEKFRSRCLRALNLQSFNHPIIDLNYDKTDTKYDIRRMYQYLKSESSFLTKKNNSFAVIYSKPYETVIEANGTETQESSFPFNDFNIDYFSPNGRWITPDVVVNKSLVTLVDINNDEIFYQIPAEMFLPTFANNGTAFNFNDVRVNWKKSYIEDWSGITISDSANQSNLLRSFWFNCEISNKID